jgi:signal transduction histidine kinase
MSAAPASFFAPDHEPQVAGHDAASLPSSKISGRQHSMTQLLFMRSNTFRWALVVAGVLAVFVISLFGFIYWKTDDYLVARSDKMIASQINFIASLTGDRQLDAIGQDVAQDSRDVHYAGLFGADGHKLAGNLEQLPPQFQMNDSVQNVSVTRLSPAGRETHVIRAIARHLPNGNTLVIGREVDEAKEISQVVGQALALGLLPALGLCLLAGAWLSMRVQKQVEEVNQRVQRIIAGDLRERLPDRSVDEPFSKLAAIVNGMLDEMETMINALAGVGNDIAHDLRTPLTRARLALERGRTNATTPEQFHAATDKAIANIDQSLTIITALLRLAEIENNRRSAAFGEVPLHEMLREVYDLYEPIAEAKNINLRVEVRQQSVVRGDRDLLFEAVANLVDNAIKFTPEGGRVDIELTRGDGEIILRVTDTGCGIGEQEREAVLRRFYRSDKIRNTPGVGLGLSLVSAIVKLHGFRLAIHSGSGSRLEIICSGKQA